MDIRKDFLKNDTIIYSSARSNKPTNYKNDLKSVIKSDDDFKLGCPFCESNEKLIGELLLFDEKTKARVVKNTYPVVQDEIGFHDVAIESLEHGLQFKDMTSDLVFEFLKLLKKRCEMVLSNDHIKSIQIFKNSGPFSGASLEHSHWQILSLNYVPKNIVEISKNFDNYFKENKNCYLCDNDYSYNVSEDDYMKVVLPKAAAVAQTLRIYPKVHKGSFLDLDDSELMSLSKMLVFSVNLVDKLFEGNSYNILFYSKPICDKNEDFENFHFFAEVMGRKGRLGGFELSTGEYVSSTSPEQVYDEIKLLMSKN